ncbi:hypothetical protein E2C01_030929 [Portunus trituberculatus]|uniref:Uncharacterized protein n=1 Tax=Portunus trituberculatus TaxID=210409 RepID=A0A5B7EWQ5_PORTR|nr:hypothetical protein [Portunus trituberculatus]
MIVTIDNADEIEVQPIDTYALIVLEDITDMTIHKTNRYTEQKIAVARAQIKEVKQEAGSGDECWVIKYI